MENIKLPHDVKEYIKRKIAIRVAVCVVFLAAVVTVLICWGEMLFGGFGKYNMIGIYVLLLLLPFAVTAAPVYLLDKSWHGIISHVELKSINSFKKGTMKIMIRKIQLEVTIDRDDGKQVVKIFDEINPSSIPKDWSEKATDFRVGDDIYHIAGLKHPLVIHQGHSELTKCIVCGLRNPAGNERCVGCGHSLIERI